MDQSLIRRLDLLEQRTGKLLIREAPFTKIRVRAYNSANISIANNTLTTLTFDSERWDTSSMHSTSVNTSRLTCTVAGLYKIMGQVDWAANVTGRRSARILLNGTTILGVETRPAITDAGVGTVLTVHAEYELTVGDYVELLVFQLSGGALNVNASSNYSPEFMMSRIA